MIEWRRVPWTLWVYSAFVLAGVILIEVEVHGRVPSKVLFPFVMFVWLIFLLNGVRWVWLVTVGLSVLWFVGDLISGSFTLQGTALGLIEPALLLLPTTRRYFGNEPDLVSSRSTSAS